MLAAGDDKGAVAKMCQIDLVATELFDQQMSWAAG